MSEQPPTPPREVSKAVDDAVSFLDDSHEIERALSKSLMQRRSSLQAAVPSPAASQESATASTAKKVGFSPHPVYHQSQGNNLLELHGNRPTEHHTSTRPGKPLKSILKLTHAPPLTPDDLDTKLSYFSPDVPGSFAKMLQSVLTQLASQSVTNRLDAYLILNGSLQTYGDVPDTAALVQQLGLLTQFLARDMAWKNSDGRLDTNIALQALKLTNVLLFNDNISAALDSDFRCFLVDRSINVTESTDTPKQIMKAHVHLLAQPKLQAAAMSASRADKILNALQTIDQRCSGNNVISTRLVIYQRLLEQAPTLMLTRAREWLEQTFHCMLSSISDVRGRAIDTCTKGGIRLGTQPHAAKAMSDFLDTEIDEGQSYYQYFSAKIIEMLGDKETAACVPRIWSALVLYFRNRRKPLEKWTGFRSWLVIIQKCLNSSDVMVRYEATLAWNKLVYTATSDASLSTAMMKMLKTPIVSGIERRGHDPFSRQIRQHAIDCYHNLLHYGLRPSLSAQELESAWDVLVDPVLSSMIKASAKGQTTACRMICGLLSSNGGVWNANAALMATPIRSEDLPRLDPRWIRSNIAKVLTLLQPALRSSLWSSQELNSAVHPAWAALMQTASDAGAQEVKTSNDLKQAIAHLVGVSRQLWSCRSAPRDSDVNHFRSNYISLLEAMISTIGPGHFTEDFLATSNSDLIEVAPTPSTKRSKHHSAPQSPIVLILGPLFTIEGVGNACEIESQPTASHLLRLFVTSRPTTLASLEFLARTYFALQNHSDSPTRYDQQSLWKAFASSMTMVLKSVSSTAQQQQQQQPENLGLSLKHSTDVFGAGLPTVIELEPLMSLYDAMYEAAKVGSNDGGIVLGVMEPAAKAIASEATLLSVQRRLQLAEYILSKAVWPKTRQYLESARKSLWGVGLAPSKASTFDPFDQVYSMTVNTMISMYESLDDGISWERDTGRQFFATTVAFLEKAPLSLLLTGIRRTQEGFAAWIQDEARKTGNEDGESQQMTHIWTALLRLITGLPCSDSNLIKALEPLLVAGFSSPHRQIVNETILFWNAKFGREESLEYPAHLEGVLRSRMLDASIDLPTFPDSNDDHVPATLPEFFHSQSQPTLAVVAHPQDVQTNSCHQEPTRNAQPAQSVYFTAQRSPVANAATAPSTIDRRSATSGSSTPKARLRHDDSQIQFAPIDSSPIRFEEESQHLTEHQAEVKERQSVAALMFPELSSSPMAQSAALPRALPKRLDFSSEVHKPEQDGDVGTPTALPDAAGLMSDDMPSSPTPSSNRDASQAALDIDEDQATEDELDDPPSSPPKNMDREDAVLPSDENYSDAIGPEDTTVDVTDFGLDKVVYTVEESGVAEAFEPEPSVRLQDDAADLPSDSILPTEQLMLEAEAAEMQAETRSASIDTAVDTTVVPEAASQDAAVPGEVTGPESRADGVTRIEDSFIGQPRHETAIEEDGANSQSSRKPTRKRKRSSSVVYTAKKQKSASPFKRFISKIWPNSQQDDDDMEDEIVVASSQRSQSPSSPTMQQPATSSPFQRVDELSQPIDEPTTDPAAVKQEVMPPPPKRRPGRPRKSATPTPSLSESQDETPQSRPLKRQASVLSNVSASETDAPSSLVRDTPAPSKSRKTRKGQTSSQGSDVTSPHEARTTRRTATAVLIPLPEAGAQAETEKVSSTAADAADGASTRQESVAQAGDAVSAVSPSDQRPKLTPMSILGRLRDVLSDFVGMKVSTTEAREFDDVLFEFRREVHEADRRGRKEKEN